MRHVLLAVLLAAGCRGPGDAPAAATRAGQVEAGDGRVNVRVQYTPRDSTPFTAASRFHRCRPTGAGIAHGFLLDGTDGGNGILVWLRTPDTVPAGTYPVLSRWDTTTTRGAVVAIRFVIGDAAHGLALDSGSVAVTAAPGGGGGRGVSARMIGAGLEAEGARKVHAEARFGVTTLAADTVDCAVLQ
jgi:hypothetical protein